MVHAFDGTLDTHVPWISWDRTKNGEVVPTMRPPTTEALNGYLKAQGVKGKRFKLLGGAHSMIERFLSLPGIITDSSHSHDYSLSHCTSMQAVLLWGMVPNLNVLHMSCSSSVAPMMTFATWLLVAKPNILAWWGAHPLSELEEAAVLLPNLRSVACDILEHFLRVGAGIAIVSSP